MGPYLATFRSRLRGSEFVTYVMHHARASRSAVVLQRSAAAVVRHNLGLEGHRAAVLTATRLILTRVLNN